LQGVLPIHLGHRFPLKNLFNGNLKRWGELLADLDLARLPDRIETNRHGHILMSTPPAPAHSDQQSEIAGN